jgi:hypothetical protein
VARDLLLGRTKRSWAAGFADLEHRALAENVLASRDVEPLAKEVESGIQQNFKKILELSAAKKLPEGERKSYAKVVRRFRDLETRRGKKYVGTDYVELRDLQGANRRTATRLAELGQKESPGLATQTNTAEAKVLRLSRLNLVASAVGLLAAIHLASRISPGKNVS